MYIARILPTIMIIYYNLGLNYFLATEAHDDDGLPHTLEHLVFMGSENYPYKVFFTLL